MDVPAKCIMILRYAHHAHRLHFIHVWRGSGQSSSVRKHMSTVRTSSKGKDGQRKRTGGGRQDRREEDVKRVSTKKIKQVESSPAVFRIVILTWKLKCWFTQLKIPLVLGVRLQEMRCFTSKNLTFCLYGGGLERFFSIHFGAV